MGTRSLRRLSPEAVERNEERTPGVSIVRMRVEDCHWITRPQSTIVRRRHEPEGSRAKRRRGG